MKKIFKFFPAALAVMALASCSDIDAPDQNGAYTTSEKGDLIVEVEQFDNLSATRAYRDADGNSLTFKNKDIVKIYDDELYKYDIYEFKDNAFYLQEGEEKILATPKYGLFPGDMVVRGYYDKPSKTTVAEFAIPETIVYDAESEIKVGDKVLYAANLPMFGLAEDLGEKVGVKKLRHVCGVLKLQLDDTFSNATWLRLISSEKALSGTFVAKLTASTEDARKAVKLEEGLADLKTEKYIYIDLRNIPSRKSVIYIPIIPGIDANADGLHLDYTTENATEGDYVGTWTESGLKFPKEVIAQNKLYEAEHAFQLTNMNPIKVNALLDQYKETTSPIDLVLANDFKIDGSTNGYQINIPALNEGVDVSIKLGETFGAKTGEGWNNSVSGLDIQDLDANDPFEGTFTLDLGGKFETADVKKAGHLNINLPNADVKLIGDFTTMLGTKNLNITAAKSVTFGDGTNATVIPQNTSLFNLGSTKKLNVAAKAIVGKDITSTVKNIEAEISGRVLGAIDFTTLYNSKLTLNSDLTYEANASDRIVVTGNVTTGGDIEIALKSEGEAIQGTLTMKGSNTDLDLKSGYVNAIVVDVANTGEWESPFINFNLDKNVEIPVEGSATPRIQGQKAFNSLTITNGKVNYTKCIWDGQNISDVTYALGSTKYNNKYVTFNDGTTTVTEAIFTASQLRSIQAIGADANIYLDLDLNNKAWTGTELTNGGIIRGTTNLVDSKRKTIISNLNLAAAGGFIKTVSGASALSINDLTIDGVTATHTAALAGIGALVGNVTATGKLTVSNVDVKNIAIAANSKDGKILSLKTVGGLIGQVTGGADVDLVKTTTAGTIDAYSEIGGFIGASASAVKFDKDCKAEVTIAQSFDSGASLDIDYAKIGGFIGTVTGTKNITINGAATPTMPTHKGEAIEYISNTEAGVGVFYKYVPNTNQPYVGYSGAGSASYAYALGTITVNNAAGTEKVADYVQAKFGDVSKKNPDAAYGAKEAAAYSFAKK